MRNQALCFAGLLLAVTGSGCVRRTLTINTEPVRGARVFLNDEDIGVTPLEVDFTWYGDYDVIVRHPDYETLSTHWHVREPWYQYPPFDFVTEALIPFTFHDRHARTFELTERTEPTREELVQRADQMREAALFSEE